MAAGATEGINKSFKSAAALAANTIVKFGANDDTVAAATAVTEDLIGISQHATTAAGEEVRVALTGIAELKIGGNVTRGGLLTADENGLGVAATQHAHTENTAANYTQNATTGAAAAVRVIGRALASGVSGDIIPVLLAPGIA